MGAPKKENPENGAGVALTISKKDEAKTTDLEQLQKMLETEKEQRKKAEEAAKDAFKVAERLEGELSKRLPKSVNDVLLLAAKAASLESKLKKLEEAKRDLSAFAASNTEQGESLKLSDGANTFTTSNSEVLKAVKSLILQHIQTKQEQTNGEILALSY